MFSANTRIMDARNPGLVMILILALTACEGEQPQVTEQGYKPSEAARSQVIRDKPGTPMEARI